MFVNRNLLRIFLNSDFHLDNSPQGSCEARYTLSRIYHIGNYNVINTRKKCFILIDLIDQTMRAALFFSFKNYFYIARKLGKIAFQGTFYCLHERIDRHSNGNNATQVIRCSSSIRTRSVFVPPQLSWCNSSPLFKFFVVHIGLFVQMRIKKKCWLFFSGKDFCHKNWKRMFAL